MQEEKRVGSTEDQLQVKFRPKTRSIIRSENVRFFHSGKQHGRGWNVMSQRV